MKYKYDVFISYSRNDYVDNKKEILEGNVISDIKDALRNNNISYWIDEEGNLTGKKFAHIIASKIRESMTFLFVCSLNSVASRWVDRELSVADTLDKHIIPFICDDSYMDDKVIMFTSSLDRVEYFRNPQKEMEKLISTIKKDKTELEKRILEEERIRQQKLKEAEEKERKEKAKKEISELITSYKIHSVQQESIVQQLYRIHKKMGHELKQCPICDNMVLMNKSFCETCGWPFPPLYAIDEDSYLTCDKKQLALARTNWQTIGKAISLKEENINLKGEKENLSTECRNLRDTINSLQNYIDPLQKENKEIRTLKKTLEEKLNEAEARLKAEEKIREDEAKLKAEEELKNRSDEETFRELKLRPIQKGGLYGYADTSGKVIIPCRWMGVGLFSEGLAKVEDSQGNWGYIDKRGILIIPCQWIEALAFSDGLALVKDSDWKWWKIDNTGKVVGEAKL